MSTSGPYFATAGDDVKIWDAQSLQVVKQFNYHKGNVKDIAWSRDNTMMCSASASGDKLLVTDCQLNQPTKPKIVAEHAIDENQTCVRVSHSGRRMYSGGMGGDVNVWERETGQLKKSYKDTHSSPVTCIAVNEYESHVASGSNKGDVVIRNIGSNATSKPKLKSEGQAVRSMAFSPWKHSLVGMTMDDGSIHLWDTLQSTLYHEFVEIHNAPAMSLSFSHFNDLLVSSVGLDKKLIIYDTKSKKYLNKASLDQPLTSVAFMLDGVTLIAGSSLGQIYQLDLRSMSKPVKEALGHSTSVQRVVVQNSVKVKKERSSSKRRVMSEKSSKSVSSDNESKISTPAPTPISGLHDRPSQRSLPPSSGKPTSTSTNTRPQLPNNSTFLTNTGTPPIAVSTPFPNISTPAPHTLRHHVDDYGDLISPVRDDAFGENDLETSSGQQGSFSFSTTTGSFNDDIVSPVANHTKAVKGFQYHGISGKQSNTRTSPHPLRQSNNPSLNGHSIKPEHQAKPTELSSHQRIKMEKLDIADSGSVSLHTTLHHSINESKKQDPAPDSSQVRIEETKSTVEEHEEKGEASNQAVASSKPDAPSFQYQAEFIRNIVKDLVDEMGDDIRSQVNELSTQMVKLSIFQEDLFRELLLHNRCGINEQLLEELERVKQENERLKRMLR
ncbi:protein NEDD1 isoform X2 [Ciona intestinalis]